ELFEAVDADNHLYISVFLLSHHLLAKQMVNEESSCVSASRIALLQVRYSLIPDGTGIRQPSTSLTPTARLPASGLRASLACGQHKGMAVALSSRLP
ncbi:hypothetical protein JTL98_33775, partial [Pseudomonas aeruginosa]|nr:hypothetical protein [Pseudomonas aeruginosa]